VLWQASQLFVVVMWALFLPVAPTPSWQLAHDCVIPTWLKCAGTQAVVR